ncbi:MAG TPA: hypothetical protein VHT91_30655, partial [Kofleriaceae bacterium]|nr:hypothetical protein [Kofleriaceae bacterium]
MEAGQSTGSPLAQVRIAERDVKAAAVSRIGQDAQWKQLMCQGVECGGELLLGQQLARQPHDARFEREHQLANTRRQQSLPLGKPRNIAFAGAFEPYPRRVRRQRAV